VEQACHDLLGLADLRMALASSTFAGVPTTTIATMRIFVLRCASPIWAGFTMI
jgi:hypothetical protein